MLSNSDAIENLHDIIITTATGKKNERKTFEENKGSDYVQALLWFSYCVYTTLSQMNGTVAVFAHLLLMKIVLNGTGVWFLHYTLVNGDVECLNC